jgi:ethanolamine ammonia-lyase small subunit
MAAARAGAKRPRGAADPGPHGSRHAHCLSATPGSRPGAAAELRKRRGAAADIAFSVSDGLSAAAIDAHFLPLWEKIETALKAGRLTRFPLVLVPFGRVAVGDAIGEALGAKLSVIFIGERPGLTSADSLGIYLTYQPRRGTPDASRNCLSNIRPPEGMGYELASEKLLYYVRESLRRQISGVTLKEGPPALGT